MNPPDPSPAQKDLFQSPEFLITVGALSALLIVGALVIHFAGVWRKRQLESDDPRADTLTLTNYRDLYENGEITRAEYEKIRDKLAAKLKQKGKTLPAPPPDVGPDVLPTEDGE
jgi:DNA-binding HxlR family transcriptional regulator